MLCSCQYDRGKQMGPEWQEINIPKGSCSWDVCAENLLPVSTSHLLVLPKGSFCSTAATSSPSCKSISNSCVALHLRLAWYSDSVPYVDNSLDLWLSVWCGDSSWKAQKVFIENDAEAVSKATRMHKNQHGLHVATDPTFLHTCQGVTYTAVCNQISSVYAARTCPTTILIGEQ